MTRVVVLIAAIAAAGCFSSPTAPDAVVGRPFELKPGAVSVLPDGTRLVFREVPADSRCPMDVMCVWAGDATVAIRLTPSQSAAESRELHTQPAGSTISYANFTITLSALAPYPRSTQPIRPDDYVATFVVNSR
jgi:hypothetical protein